MKIRTLYSNYTNQLRGQRKFLSLDALDELQEDGRHLAFLCACHGALVETAMFSRQCKHSCDLNTKSLPTTFLTRILCV